MGISIFLPAFFIGLMGSVHCVGMCGPLALALPMQENNKWAAIVLYLSGKTFTYSLLGLFFGLFGSSFVIAGLQQVLSVLLGIGMLCIAIALFFKKAWFHGGAFSSWASMAVSRWFIKVMESRSVLAPVLFGMLNGLLPCGLVYMGIIGAMATASARGGMLYMAAFGVGTMPAMLLFLLMAKKLSFKGRMFIQNMTPFLLVVLAGLLVVRGLGLAVPYLSPALSEASVVEKVASKMGCMP